MRAQPCRTIDGLEMLESLLRPGSGLSIIGFWSHDDAVAVRMQSVFAAVAETIDTGTASFFDVWNDLCPEIAQVVKIRAVPSVLFVDGGQVVEAHVGRVQPERLRQTVVRLAANNARCG